MSRNNTANQQMRRLKSWIEQKQSLPNQTSVIFESSHPLSKVSYRVYVDGADFFIVDKRMKDGKELSVKAYSGTVVIEAEIDKFNNFNLSQFIRGFKKYAGKHLDPVLSRALENKKAELKQSIKNAKEELKMIDK